MKKNIVALVPLRGASKSIPKKNIRPMAGKPLCGWVLEAACGAIGASNVFVSTESREIAGVVEDMDMGIRIIDRPAGLAKDTSTTESVMLHFAEKVNFDVLITLQATSPLTTATDIKNALNIFKRNRLDSLLTGVRNKRFFWTPDGKAVNYDPAKRPRRQDFDGWIMENGAFYITGREILERHKCRLGGKIGIYEMPPETSVEIDEPEDWAEAERLLIRRARKDMSRLIRDIKLLVVDVDGTLTDGGMYYSKEGEALKKFNTRDAQGLALLREEGIDVAIVTKENSPIVEARAKKLKIDKCYTGIDDKLGCLKKICRELKIDFSNVAYVGDDVSDLECMKEARFAACPADAIETIRDISHHICRHTGGAGAVREVCELISQCSTEIN
ncbi:MAG: acylneuraminate cytidylyltransferase [Nitrospiraceae bacterium]|nr:MAG: acylneuraminate cytidylyltransferase [Nitrospiraceae bacterium]